MWQRWKPMPLPFLASTVLLAGSIASMYLFEKYHATLPNNLLTTMAGLMYLFIASIAFLGGVGGIVVSVGIKPYPGYEGNFKPSDNWLGSILDDVTPEGQGFCIVSVGAGTIIVTAGMACVAVAGALYLIYLVAMNYPYYAAIGVCAIAGIALVMNRGTVGKVSRFIFWVALAGVVGYVATYKTNWQGLGQEAFVPITQFAYHEILPLALFIAGCIAAVCLFVFFTNTKVYRKMCPKRG